MKTYTLYTRDRNYSEYRPYDIVKKDTDIAGADIYEAAQKADVLITEKKRFYEGLDLELFEGEKRLAVRLFYKPNPFGTAPENIIDSKAIKVTDMSFWRGWVFMDPYDEEVSTDFLSIADAATELNCSNKMVYYYIRKERLAACPEGITRDSLEKFKTAPKAIRGRPLGSKRK